MVPGPRKDMLDLGLKFMSQRLRYFHCQCSLFCASFPSPFSASTQSQRTRGRQCFSCPPDTCLGLLGPSATPGLPTCQPQCCFPHLLLGWVGRGEPHLQRFGSPWAQLGCLAGQGQELLMCRWHCFMQGFSKGSTREPFG